LKHRRIYACYHSVKEFPRLRRRGPIEAVPLVTSFAGVRGVSTPEEAWPH